MGLYTSELTVRLAVLAVVPMRLLTVGVTTRPATEMEVLKRISATVAVRSVLGFQLPRVLQLDPAAPIQVAVTPMTGRPTASAAAPATERPRKIRRIPPLPNDPPTQR